MTPSMRTMDQPTEMTAQIIHQSERKNNALFYFGGCGDYLYVFKGGNLLLSDF